MLEFRGRETRHVESFDAMLRREKLGPAYTAILDGRVIGCSGVMIQWPGVGTAWAMFTDKLLQYPVWTTRTVRHALHDIIRAFNLHRVELVALADVHRNQHWAKMLGFSREDGGVAHQYLSDKSDMIRFELIRGDHART